MPFDLKDNAIFIADCHESFKRDHFWSFLSQIERQNPSQLFLMGDIFDLFVGGIDATESFTLPYINKLEKLAKKIDIYYFEGNHDFNLSSYFKFVKVFPITSQPVLFKSVFGGVLLSHGDFCGSKSYKIYTKFIRNRTVLKMLNFLNNIFCCAISNAILQNQDKKNLCKKLQNFEDIIMSKLQNYDLKDVKFIIEGHYHQGKEICYKDIIYHNLSSFSCDKSYFVVQFNKTMKLVKKGF